MSVLLSKLLTRTAIAVTGLSVIAPSNIIAQSVLDEIIVTGRKREESLQEVPVSISVLNAELISKAGIVDQQDLFDLTPGIHYDESGDRNAALPSVRGVQSTAVATNRTKVTAFLDGMPILGSQGSIGFNNIEQIEVYRGPQSAAFGRSTFAGAINYITRDPSDEFEASITADISDYGDRRMSASIGGPLSYNVAYLVDASWEDSDAPSDYIATDGTEYGTRSGETLAAKLVFYPTDELEVELAFSHVATEDGPNVAYFLSEEARNACYANNGILQGAMGTGVYAQGTFDCDWSQGATIAAQNDRSIAVNAESIANGLSAEDQAIREFLALAQSLPASEVGTSDTRDRATIQLDYSLDNGGAIQLSAFYGEEDYTRGNDGSGIASDSSLYGDDTRALSVALAADTNGLWSVNTTGANASAVGVLMSDPTDIEETYVEVRWVSPEDQRLRYVLGVSNYDYSFNTQIYNSGYGAILMGEVARYEELTGTVIAPNQFITEEASNTGLFFNTSYDLSDALTVSAEARYQIDNINGSNNGISGEVETKTFIPRLSFNYNLTDDASFYGQIAKGINPAGLNVGFFADDKATSLDAAFAAGDVSYDSESFIYYDEEELINYELGFKGTAFDGRFNYSAALFLMDWTDSTQTVTLDWGDTTTNGDNTLTTNRSTINQGDLQMSGLELEGSYLATDNLSIRISASYLDATYKDLCDVTLVDTGLDLDTDRIERAIDSGREYDCYSVSGLDVAQQPALSATLSPSYTADLGNSGLSWSARTDIKHSGSEWLDTANVAKTSAVTTVNFSLGLSGDAWDASLYINNLTDDDTPLSYGANDDYSIDSTLDSAGLVADGAEATSNYLITPRAPRTIGLRANYNF